MPYRDRGKWRAVVKVGGVRTSEGFPPTKQGWREAVEWEKKEKERRELREKTLTGTDFLTLYNEYLDWCQPQFTRNTSIEKQALGKRFISFIGGNPSMDEIGRDRIKDFLLFSAQERSNNRSNRDRKNLLAFWSWAGEMYPDRVPDNPVRPQKKKPHHRKSQHFPLESDILQILLVANQRERTFLNCYLQTAARRSSVFRWKWGEDIDFNLKQVRIGCAKNQEGSMEYIWLPMSEELYGDLQWWYKNRQNRTTPYVWVVEEGPYAGQPYTFRHKFLKGLCKRAGVREMGFHSLRRYAATKLAQRGVPMKSIQRILGHKSLATTEKYLGRSNEDLRATMELLANTGVGEKCETPSGVMKTPTIQE